MRAFRTATENVPDMNARTTLLIAALAGFTGVALGAFGAHGLKTVLSADMMTVWHTAVQYHLVHAVVLLALALAQRSQTDVWLSRSALLMTLGLLLFSGSLYTMALTGIRTLGIITPFGGVSWLIGWALLIPAALRIRNTDNA
tara:strand:- start:2828 stop:3256 length:429 start_codon:yes stop_codon:yes gene_type:complete